MKLDNVVIFQKPLNAEQPVAQIMNSLLPNSDLN